MKTVICSCRDPLAQRRIVGGLTALEVPHRVVAPHTPWRPTEPHGTTYCIDSPVAMDLVQVPEPMVVVLIGARVSDEVIGRLCTHRFSTLSISDITPRSLLRALVAATASTHIDYLVRRLQRDERLRGIDGSLIAAFLEDPSCAVRLSDLRRATLRQSRSPLSREKAQGLVRACGFRRAEHLFTALRSATSLLLRELGVDRTVVDEYLGIHNRAAFRRACDRAGLPAPRRSDRVAALTV